MMYCPCHDGARGTWVSLSELEISVSMSDRLEGSILMLAEYGTGEVGCEYSNSEESGKEERSEYRLRSLL